MSTVMEVLAAATDRPMAARSLFLWQGIMGSPDRAIGEDFEDAAPALLHLARPLVLGPPGADAAPVVIAITPAPEGFDIQEQALPGADAVFAFVPEAGLRLVLSVDIDDQGQLIRRLQVLDAAGGLYRRSGTARFMLRYQLGGEVLQARDLVFLSITRNAAAGPSPMPPLHVWLEVDQGNQRNFILSEETRACQVGASDQAHLSVFPIEPLARFATGSDLQGVFLFVELTGETIDIRLMGEQLLF